MDNERHALDKGVDLFRHGLEIGDLSSTQHIYIGYDLASGYDLEVLMQSGVMGKINDCTIISSPFHTPSTKKRNFHRDHGKRHHDGRNWDHKGRRR